MLLEKFFAGYIYQRVFLTCIARRPWEYIIEAEDKYISKYKDCLYIFSKNWFFTFMLILFQFLQNISILAFETCKL